MKKQKKIKTFLLKSNGKLIQWVRSYFQFSKNKTSKFLNFPLKFFLLSEYKHEIFGVLKEPQKRKKKFKRSFQKMISRSFLDLKLKLLVFEILIHKTYMKSKYVKVLTKAHPNYKYQYIQILLNAGFLDLSRLTALDLVNHHLDIFSEKRQSEIYCQAALAAFLKGLNEQACELWKKYGKIKRTWQLPSTPSNYRIMGNDWFAAIGHTVMLDFYFKHKILYGGNASRFVVINCLHGNDFMKVLSRKFFQFGLAILDSRDVKSDFNQWQAQHKDVLWDDLDQIERDSLVDDFWSYEFPDGEILGYAHGASRIQKDWERANYGPLVQVSDEEKKWLDEYKDKIGLPRDAWYVCLHVREAGYHESWNKLYPTIRDAKIKSYYQAIKEITDAGGWVIRMGDPSMQPLPDFPNVIDYANSPFRRSLADLLFPATSKFFIGTNSGYATVPVIFGVPCALTNWVPIGWPLWASQDLMICKLFREKETKRYLSLEELFDRGLAFIQNVSDLPIDIEVVDNSSIDIAQLTCEMLEACVFKHIALKEAGTSESIMLRYEELAKKHKAFSGSRFGRHFVSQYPQVFGSVNEKIKEKINQKKTLELQPSSLT